MKKLLLSLLLACVYIYAQAYNFSVENSNGVTIYYNILSDTDLTCAVTYKTTSYNSYSGLVDIPSAVNYNGKEYSVTSIGSSAFYNCSNLTYIDIPSNVTSIGSSAFYNCSNLTCIDIPSKIKVIEDYTFYGCTKLENIQFPSMLTTIGKNAFWYCDNLKAIILPASIRSISGSAFCYNSNPLNVTVLAERPPVCAGNTGSSVAVNIFDDKTFKNGVLNVQSSAYNAYISISPWCKFNIIKKIGENSYNKCSVPVITYLDKTLSFSCATPQSQIHYSYYLGNMGTAEPDSGLITRVSSSLYQISQQI